MTTTTKVKVVDLEPGQVIVDLAWLKRNGIKKNRVAVADISLGGGRCGLWFDGQPRGEAAADDLDPDELVEVGAASHTPGPWAIEEFDTPGGTYGRILAADDRLICSVADESDSPYDAQAQADAKLIAAAPELLSVLEVTLGNLRSLKGNAFKQFDTLDVWISECEKAIASARGAL